MSEGRGGYDKASVRKKNMMVVGLAGVVIIVFFLIFLHFGVVDLEILT